MSYPLSAWATESRLGPKILLQKKLALPRVIGATPEERFAELHLQRTAVERRCFDGTADRCDIALNTLLDGRVDRSSLHAALANKGYLYGFAYTTSHIGELVQGAISIPPKMFNRVDPSLTGRDTARFLIDLPCKFLWSTAEVVATAGSGDIKVDPIGLTKAAKAAEALLAFLDLDQEVDVFVDLKTNIGRGRGLGSSSADVRAVICALANALNIVLDQAAIDCLTVLRKV